MAPESRYRVIQWATGNTGVLTLRGIVEHPDLELVGLWVHSADKEGRDAGEIAGLGPVGVPATRDVAALLALDADCVCYLSTDMGRPPEEIVDDVCTFLSAGLNVVGTQYCLAAPQRLPAELAEKLAAACEQGSSTLYGCGLEPDGNQAILVAAMSMAQRVDAVSIAEMHNVELYDEPTGAFFGALGFGMPLGAEPDPALVEMFNNHMMRPIVDLMAHGLGVDIDRYEHHREFAATDRPIQLPHQRVEPGATSAVHNWIEGVADGGALRIAVHQYYWLGDYPENWPSYPAHGGYTLDVKGTPDISLQYAFGSETANPIVAALLATGMRLVNAVPAVCAAPPGVRTLFEMPHILPKVGKAAVDVRPVA